MNKNKIVILIVILFTVVILAGGWFFLQYVMDKYDIDRKDWDDTTYSLQDVESPSSTYMHSLKID